MWVCRTLFALALVGLAGGAVPVGAVGSLRAEIEAVYRQWDRLTAAKDVEGLAKMLDPSYKGIGPDGEVEGYRAVVRHLRTWMAQLEDVRSHIVVDEIHRQGTNEVVAWITMRASATIRQDKKRETMKFTMRFAETLKKTPNGWKFVASQAFPM
jgi:ketosteroid isomerase-like protein